MVQRVLPRGRAYLAPVKPECPFRGMFGLPFRTTRSSGPPAGPAAAALREKRKLRCSAGCRRVAWKGATSPSLPRYPRMHERGELRLRAG